MAQQQTTESQIAGNGLENLHSEMISFRMVLDRLAQEDGQDGSLGGLSYWLQRIIGDFEESKCQLQDLLSEYR